MAESGSSVIRRVKEAFVNRRTAAFEESETKKAELYPVIPGLRELDCELSKTGAKIMNAAMSGGDVDKKIAALKEENLSLREQRRALLRQYGYPGDYTDIKYSCPVCSDTGFDGISMCRCMRLELSRELLEASGIGRLAAEQSFDSFSLDYYTGAQRGAMEHNMKQLRDFAEGFGGDTDDNWLLIGNTGLGKTHLSTAVAAEVIAKGYYVVYQTMQEMVEAFADEQFRGVSRESVAGYYDCDLLIIDDLGAELTNQFTVSCLYNVINRRINKRLSTVFSTNLNQAELRERYADRITSRLFGEYKPLVFMGTDVRRQKLSGEKKEKGDNK